MNREKWLKGLKLAIAAVIAIALADAVGLKYSATAGIITILSIQNTKMETLKVAGRRAAAFLCALLAAAVCFHMLGFSIAAFAVYLFFFSCICLYFGWTEAISMDSVLISHFLVEQNMGMELLTNECLLFVIGAGMGILANLHLHRKADEFEALAAQADQQMREVLGLIQKQLLDGVRKSGETGGISAEKNHRTDGTSASRHRESRAAAQTAEALKKLDYSLRELQECAHRNWNNTLLHPSSYETDYADMRSGQARVLQHISASADLLEVIPDQAQMVAKLLERVEAEYAKENTVESLLDHMQEVYAYMRQEHLPQTRDEFEARAVLFYVLKQVEEFLWMKRRFVMGKRAV